ncbi:hypothetical protein ACTJKK_03145 [Microbacterium sp. 22179]|uniref:hypothetical protein n=1 Tax=Microbacterium sp. 22179 TaxID=3453886 RepID=UPI003F871C49
MPIVHDFFAQEDDTRAVPSNVKELRGTECKATYSHPVRVHRKKSFRLHTNSKVPAREHKERNRAYMSRVLYTLLVQEGLKWKNHRVHVEKKIPTWDDLSNHLDEWAMDGKYAEHTEVIQFAADYEIATGNADRKGSLNWDQLEHIVSGAVDYVEDTWDETWYPRMIAKARKGGQAGRKWDLEQYLDTYDMTPTAAARHLGVSRPTVYAMRKHFDSVFDMSTGEVLDEDAL